MITEEGNVLYLIWSGLLISTARTVRTRLVQASHLLEHTHSIPLAFSRCSNLQKHAKLGSGYLCDCLSDSPLPHKTSTPLKPGFPCCALGRVSSCEEVWLGRKAESKVVVFGAEFSLKASSDLEELCLVWGINRAVCILTWYKLE